MQSQLNQTDAFDALNGAPRWSTASFGNSADTRPGDFSGLGEHLDLCRSLRGRLFALQCRAEAVHRFIAPRFVTSLVALTMAVALLAGAVLLVV